MTPAPDIDGAKAVVVQLLERLADQERTLIALRDENASLEWAKGPARCQGIKPPIKPSGIGKASRPERPKCSRRGGGNKTAKRVIHEERIITAVIPGGVPGGYGPLMGFIQFTMCPSSVVKDWTRRRVSYARGDRIP
jgi:hypothetical protein